MRCATLVIMILCLAAVASLSGCQRAAAPQAGTVPVVATFYPLFEAAQRVGGENASVGNLVPAGTEPHEFDPTPRDIISLTQARIVVYNGAGFEPWLDRVMPDLRSAGIVLVNASRGIDLLQMTAEDDPSKKAPDPHFWLDPVLMQGIVVGVKDAYVQVDSRNQAAYEENARRYVAELQALQEKYQRELAGAGQRTIVTSHAAFNYLARRYNLDVIHIAGLNPTDEPSPRQLAEITKVVRERGIKYIFFETLVSPRLAETIAREASARTLVLNPLEGLTREEMAAGKSYISVMEENLANLKLALGAQQ